MSNAKHQTWKLGEQAATELSIFTRTICLIIFLKQSVALETHFLTKFEVLELQISKHLWLFWIEIGMRNWNWQQMGSQELPVAVKRANS